MRECVAAYVGSRIPDFWRPEAWKRVQGLRAHEIGVIAGMHAALAQVLHRFEPAELEKRLKPAGALTDLLPNSHKARLWEAFSDMYVDISREAQDDSNRCSERRSCKPTRTRYLGSKGNEMSGMETADSKWPRPGDGDWRAHCE